ncbi:hypothetical protein BcepSauron_298 [Burkholderia phage BcepSauron]|uniref:Uncharacterized protein n=1 Tax=Burkholderia phage BcepSauron TaxID=2530033 RepID=A0A482MLZ2_9CAUD|nr:hypothetical protein H1O17_gp298 [Burkholderia phage BcepSauron]QBQ74678.1 hypothetical protein BcepSauron_298 [Burkholderia phage BcepSauron]
MVLNAYGLVDASPIQVSETLRALNLSHTFVGGFGRTTHTTIDGLSAEQPVWPIIIDRVRNIHKVSVPYDRLVYFVCDARAPLSLCNVDQSLWPEKREGDLDTAVMNALRALNPEPGIEWSLTMQEPTLDDYVGQAAQPSFLNLMQGITCKINPYSLRKEAQRMAVAYLASGISRLALRRAYRGNSKLVDLMTILDSPDALNLRNAVVAARTSTPDRVAPEFGVHSFEISYIMRSFATNGT